MATTYFDTINGEITGEFTSGVQKDYMRDALGSVTGYVDSNGTVVNRYWNKPYAAQLAKIGSGADPAFLWCGSPGYRPLGRTGATHDVRARDYDSATGRWTTVDPLWPSQAPYSYVRQAPNARADPSGTADVAPDFAANYAVVPSGSYDIDFPITGVDANVTLPLLCSVVCPGDYLDFYISLHNWTTLQAPPANSAGYEAGVSFSPPHWYGSHQWFPGGWRAFLHAEGGQNIYIQLANQQAGQTVRMRLLILQDRAATGQFTIWGGNPPRQQVVTKWLKTAFPTSLQWPGANAGYGKILNAGDSTSSCKVAASVAAWGPPPGADSGSPVILPYPGQWTLGPAGWSLFGYSTTDKVARRNVLNPDWAVDPPWPPSPLVNGLRDWQPMAPCDPSQFATIGYWLERFCCCGPDRVPPP